jgi:hypothetical protein
MDTSCAQQAADIEPIDAGQHDVEQDGIERLGLREPQARIAADRQLHGARCILQMALEDLGEFLRKARTYGNAIVPRFSCDNCR